MYLPKKSINSLILMFQPLLHKIVKYLPSDTG